MIDREIYTNFRSKDILIGGFDDIQILFRYLYMDENHSVIFNNGICNLELTMTPDMLIKRKNMNFPHLEPMLCDINLNEFIGIIDQLKHSKAVQFPDYFTNRWEEIKSITLDNLVLNRKNSI